MSCLSSGVFEGRRHKKNFRGKVGLVWAGCCAALEALTELS